MDWNWNKESPQRFNPMDSGTHARIDISVLCAIDSIRLFVTGKTGTGRLGIARQQQSRRDASPDQGPDGWKYNNVHVGADLP